MKMEDHFCKSKVRRFLFKQKNDHEIVKPFLFPGARVLDFGCNDCSFFDHVNDIGNLKMVGFDVDKAALKKAKEKGYKVYDSVKKLKGPFDFIVSNEVVEHLQVNTELPEFFKKSNELLTEDGKLIVSTMNINELYCLIDFWDEPTHIRPLTVRSLKRLGREADFRISKIIKHHLRLNPRKFLVNLLLGMDLHGGYTIIFKKDSKI